MTYVYAFKNHVLHIREDIKDGCVQNLSLFKVKFDVKDMVLQLICFLDICFSDISEISKDRSETSDQQDKPAYMF